MLPIEIMFWAIFGGVDALIDSCEDPSNTVGCLLELAADWYWWKYLSIVVGEIDA